MNKTTFNGNPGISYSLTLPAAASGTLTLFDNIGADDQQGSPTGLADDLALMLVKPFPALTLAWPIQKLGRNKFLKKLQAPSKK